MMHPTKPMMNMTEFLTRIQRKRPKFDQFEAVSMMAGAIMLRVDILTAPRSATTRSSHGTVAARATVTDICNIKLLYRILAYGHKTFADLVNECAMSHFEPKISEPLRLNFF